MFVKFLTRNTLALVITTLLSLLILLVVQAGLKQRINQAQDNFLTSTLAQLGDRFPHYDNNLLADCYVPSFTQNKKDWGQLEKILVAKQGSEVTGFALISTTYQGYNGLIRFLLVTDKQGTLKAVRVLDQLETPGLGTKIVTTNWVDSFADLPLNQVLSPEFAVKKDGGNIDQFTGATITPRAIVNAIKFNAQQQLALLVAQPDLLYSDRYHSCSLGK